MAIESISSPATHSSFVSRMKKLALQACLLIGVGILAPQAVFAATCFGALGSNCGQMQGIPATALCANGRCLINGGSWTHDQCCFTNPRGMACGAPATFLPQSVANPGGHNGLCLEAWNKALRLMGKPGLNWERSVNFATVNTTGRVVHSKFCAPANQFLPRGDVQRCCSRATRELRSGHEQLQATAMGEFDLVACTAPP